MVKKLRLKIIISAISLLMALIAIAGSFAYFSSSTLWNEQQIIESGVFDVTVTAEKLKTGNEGAYTIMELNAPTIINFSEITDSENELEHLLYLRRGDDKNFDSVIHSLQLHISNVCDTDIIFKAVCNFYLGDLSAQGFDFATNAIDFVKYFIVSDTEKQNIDNKGTIGELSASYKNYIRYYSSTVVIPESTLTPPSPLTYSFLRDKMNEIRQFNDIVLNSARNISSKENAIAKCTYDDGVTVATQRDFYMFFWIDYASLEEHFKASYTDNDYVDLNSISELIGYTGLTVSSQISIEFTQSNNTDFA